MLPPPKKRLGQHFLHDENVVNRILRHVPTADTAIIEIGAGRGALTHHLIARTPRLVAIEYDRELVPFLRERFRAHDNFTVIEADALATNYSSLVHGGERARIVANLPYNIGTAILTRLIEHRACLSEMILMLQREVVERITAPPHVPGERRARNAGERGYISVFVEAYCDTEILFDVPPNSFTPPPKVLSTVVRLRPRPRIKIEVADEALLWQLVSLCFAQRRKTLHNNLRNARTPLRERIESFAGGAAEVLQAAGIEPERRAETLTLEEWGRITNLVA